MLRRKTLSLSKAFYTLPWGVHFCQFYRSISDLTDVVLPFIKAGLEGNELCLWIVSEPLSVGLAESELAAVTDVARHKTEGRLEIIGSERWYKHSDFCVRIARGMGSAARIAGTGYGKGETETGGRDMKKIGAFVLVMMSIVFLSGCVLTKIVSVPLRVTGAVISVIPVAGNTAHDAIDEAADVVDEVPI
jgi:hypothetical protein